MTDGDIVNIARKMTRIQHDLFDLITEVENSDHPNAEQIAEALREECILYAWPTHVIQYYLERPERWELVNAGALTHRNLGIRHKAANAALSRKQGR